MLLVMVVDTEVASVGSYDCIWRLHSTADWSRRYDTVLRLQTSWPINKIVI